jgi:hypothetical protein
MHSFLRTIMSCDHTQSHLAWSQRVTKEQRDADWFQSSLGSPRGALTPRWQQLSRMMQPDYSTNFDFVRSQSTLGLARPATRAQVVRQYLSTVKSHHDVLRFAFSREGTRATARPKITLNRYQPKKERMLGSQTERPKASTDLQKTSKLQALLKTERVQRQLTETKLSISRSLHSLRR